MLSLRNSWRWWVCGLLLLATMVNYMDRLTLNQLADTILTQLKLDEDDYGTLEMGFALAFAFGALAAGALADRFGAYWVYPLAVLAWSAAGFLTGFATTFLALFALRFALGLAESANWPCALKTTQRVLPPEERVMGNSLLQSGAALGAIALPILLLFLCPKDRPETWPRPFLVVGAVGALWAVLWWVVLRPSDLAPREEPPAPPGAPPKPVPWKRLAALIILVVTINMTWHCLRAWGPLFLQRKHGYSVEDTNYVAMAYYICTDIGVIAAGVASILLGRAGVGVYLSRMAVYLFCAVLAASCAAMPFLSGRALLVAMMVAGFGSLGVFPCYYSFTQDLTEKHQGKLSGLLGFSCWMVMAAWQKAIGWTVAATGSYVIPFAISGAAPLIGFAALLLLWGETPQPAPPPEEPPVLPPTEGRPQAITSRPSEISAAAH